MTIPIFGMLVNTLAADEKNPVLNRANLTKPIQMQLSRKQKTFCQFFATFSKSIWNFESIETKNDPYRFCISEIPDCDNVVRQMSKKSRSKGRFDKQHGKHAEPIFKAAWHYLYHIHLSQPSQLSWKKYLFLTCEILGLLVNILAADEKYPFVKRDNLTIPIQMQLRQKHKTFSQFFTAFLKCCSNFENFDKRDDGHRFCNFEITDSENVVREMSEKSILAKAFDKQHGKRAKALLKFALQHLYPFHWPLPSQFSWKKFSVFDMPNPGTAS